MKITESEQIVVSFDGKKCIHARRCVIGLPTVFKPGTKGGWIFPENASAEELARLIDTCPSGALTYSRKDGGAEEFLQTVNSARVWEDGPVEYRGDIHIENQTPQKRAVLCRCGQSKNKPYCDNSHISAKFRATGDIPTTESARPLEDIGGVLDIKSIKNGPLEVSGNLEIIAGSGRMIAAGRKQYLCRCGASKNKPFCDGSHNETGFEAN